jgi:hypothetical protein
MSYIQKLRAITGGWKNYLFKNKEAEEEASRRAEICAECPSASFVDGMDEIVSDPDNPKIEGVKCLKCGCPLSSKIRAMEDSCPLGKW